MNHKIFALLVSFLIVSGCSSDSKKTVDLNLHYIPANTVPTNTTNIDAQTELAEAATSVGQSLQELSAIQMAVNPRAPLVTPANAKALQMEQKTSVDWNGPVEPILQKISQASGYHLHVIGRKPAVPALVIINSQNETLADILRDITLQVQEKANLVVYPKSKVIELRYYGN